MPRPTDIIDFLPARVDGVARRDLEQRLKRLRAARLYPPARAVGDRKAEPVNDQYMANLFLALVGSAEAKYCAEAVQRLYDLPRRSHTPIDGANSALSKSTSDPRGQGVTLGNLLIAEIRRARRGELPAVHQITVVDGEADVVALMRSTDKTVKGPFSEAFSFGDKSGSMVERRIEITLSDGVIGALADFLGPIEDATE